MNAKLDLLAQKYARQLAHWQETLRQIMPEYFFRAFSSEQLEEILPLLFNLDAQSGIQRIDREGSVILVYLKSETNHPQTVARLMRGQEILGAVVHESKAPLVVKGQPRILVIEHYTVAGGPELAPEAGLPLAELRAAYRRQGGADEPRLAELYGRINWPAVADLTADKLAERLQGVLAVQDRDFPEIRVEKCPGRELRLTFAQADATPGAYARLIEILDRSGFALARAYVRQLTRAAGPFVFDRRAVTVTTLYLTGRGLAPGSPPLRALVDQLRHLTWCDQDDLLHQELVVRQGWSLGETNLLRAAAAFVHSQLAFVDRTAYHLPDIWRLMVLNEPILAELLKLFTRLHQPRGQAGPARLDAGAVRKIEQAVAGVHTGIKDKDAMIRVIFGGLLDFILNLRKTNFFVPGKACLAFRLDPACMAYYEKLSSAYRAAFPGGDRAHGIFFFLRHDCVGFQVRFADIARGGWRTVIPQKSANRLERDDPYEFAREELFREVYVLAHTQHLKNKDIYEGGSKMIALLKAADAEADHRPALYAAQRALGAAFLQLVNHDRSGRLRAKEVVDRLGRPEIIELGPDENLHDVMIDWLGREAERQDYVLGAGLISGKSDRGINHKEYGVTSFGVHQYLLQVLAELGVNPEKDAFAVKLAGGPGGDVAGNELKLLLRKTAKGWLYPRLKIVAVTDGPAAAFDPDGLDRGELLRLIHQAGLDDFSPDKLRGDGAYIVYRDCTLVKGAERHRLVVRQGGRNLESLIGRDEYMRLTEANLLHYADVFLPCGGRPATIDDDSWRAHAGERPACRAIVEGANSFITPRARDELQQAGVLIIKDASANKCGVITSSYEILCGLMLSAEEFRRHKPRLVAEIMEKLKTSVRHEADWLFAQRRQASERKLTELTEQLSRQINAKNAEIREFLEHNPKLLDARLILDHLPPLFREKYADRVDRLPAEYRKAVVAVELACRIIYRHSGSLLEQIQRVIS